MCETIYKSKLICKGKAYYNVNHFNKFQKLLARIIWRIKIEDIEGNEMCKYCEEAVPLTIGKTNDYGIVIRYPNYLEAYGYDVHGMGSNGLEVKINYCPMCGRKLGGNNDK